MKNSCYNLKCCNRKSRCTKGAVGKLLTCPSQVKSIIIAVQLEQVRFFLPLIWRLAFKPHTCKDSWWASVLARGALIICFYKTSKQVCSSSHDLTELAEQLEGKGKKKTTRNLSSQKNNKKSSPWTCSTAHERQFPATFLNQPLSSYITLLSTLSDTSSHSFGC